MREFKFRAWSNAEKTMFFVGDTFGTTHPIDALIYLKQGQDVEVMQYTGLKDSDGVEVWEGSICLCPVTIEVAEGEDFSYYNSHDDKPRTRHCCKPKPCVVEYSDRGYVFKHSSGEKQPFWVSFGAQGKLDPKIKVIGNIHENPELLEAGDE